jgi:NADH-quinone oxidoreductase subunit L
MGGLKKFMPVTFATMLVGWLAISGVPLLSGFFSKDEILYRSFVAEGLPDSWATGLWFVGAVTALLTAIYMTRLMVLTFWGNERFDASESAPGATSTAGEHDHHGGLPRESPRSMTVPLVVLAVGAVFAGYLGVPEGLSGGKIPNYFERLLEPSVASSQTMQVREAVREARRSNDESSQVRMLARAPAESRDEHGLERTLTAVSIVIALAGIGIGWLWFKRKPLWEPPKLLEQKYYVDELYDATVVQPIKQGSTNVLWKIIDVHLIDGAVNGAGHLASLLGGTIRYLQSGLARSYVAVLVLGALLIIGYFVMKSFM